VTITLGHVLLVLAAIAALGAVYYIAVAVRYRGYQRGTPQYARERTSRRLALYCLGLAILFAGLCATNLYGVTLVEAGA
jgi:hypothetical protein